MTSDPNTFKPTPDRQRDLRRAFGCFGTGVTVITTQTADGPLGMTANSFSSISLDPPLVMWSPAKSSKRHTPFVTADHFCIHVLAADQLAMAQHFAVNGADFDGLGWENGPDGAPSLSGCLAQFHCDTFAVHPAGDHSIVLGLVQHVVRGETDAPGLLFKRGTFGGFLPATTTD